MHYLSKKLGTMAILIGTVVASTAQAMADDASIHETPQPKLNYAFPQKQTPKKLLKYSSAFFSVFDNSVAAIQGRPYFNVDKNKSIKHVELAPTSAYYVTVIKGKKENQAVVYDFNEVDHEIHKFKNKKIGNPTAASFTPDARNIVIASGTVLNIIEPKKYEVIDRMDLPFEAHDMTFSGNAYFLAVSDSSRVAVINYADKKVRKEWDFGVKVNSMTFNRESTELAVLTADGVLSIYDTRNFVVKKTFDDLGQGISCDYNLDGKYISVATSPEIISVINLVKPSDIDFVKIDEGDITYLTFINDSRNNTIMAFTSNKSVNARRMTKLEPYYGKLISDQVNEKMNEWLKMMPGESMEAYRERVTDESRAKMRKLFEEEISTNLAGDPVAAAQIALGKYDRGNGILAIDFDNMPSIGLPVPEAELASFKTANSLKFSDAKYGVMADDNFELIYAKVYNSENGQTYIYDNLDRIPLNFMDGDDNVVSLEIIQQQQMEEMKLQEIRQKVYEEAKKRNVISDHTNITVDSRVEAAYNANGDKILNYIVKFSYEVDPDFSVAEDFAPGKYHVTESGAASSMLSIVKEAFENDFSQYIKAGKQLRMKIYGTADAAPIVRGIPYDGTYGDFDNEPVYKNSQLTSISVNTADGIKQNEQLAFMRAIGVKHYLEKNVANLSDMDTTHDFFIDVAEEKGGQFRRITTEFTFVDAF